jgi:hypothetical protein
MSSSAARSNILFHISAGKSSRRILIPNREALKNTVLVVAALERRHMTLKTCKVANKSTCRLPVWHVEIGVAKLAQKLQLLREDDLLRGGHG